MIRVVVEIHPGGLSVFKRTLATIDVTNISAGATEFGDYTVNAELEGKPSRVVVCNHRRSSGWMRLIRDALLELDDKLRPR